jgi:predicted RNA-binding Zn-ribbon protein involved in translation (DUF1610 family)
MLSADGRSSLKRIALGDCLPGGDVHQRVAVACLRRVRGCLRRLDRDIRTRPACGQGMILQVRRCRDILERYTP